LTFFLKTNAVIQILQKSSSTARFEHFIFTECFGRNIFKISPGLLSLFGDHLPTAKKMQFSRKAML
jgi:hypothetical protein